MATPEPSNEPIAVPPLPPRLAWFAPWRWFSNIAPWKRWTLLAVLLLTGYVLSPVPVVVTLRELGYDPTPLILTVYFPLAWLDRHSEIVQAFYQYQFDTLQRMIHE